MQMQIKPPIHREKADLQQHLIIPPTLLLRTESQMQLCATHAFPKVCLHSLQRQLFTAGGREPHKTQLDFTLHLLIHLGSSGKA